MKNGLKMSKRVTCEYKQKIVTASGKCKPKVLNGHEEFTPPTSYMQEFDDEDYMTFCTCKEIRQYFNVEEDSEWEDFKAKQVVIRDNSVNNTNTFIVFISHEAFVRYFEKFIKEQNPRNYHILNSKAK